ncbi:MAG: hydrogenase maturation nickel metallochaperone HypA [Caldilineales bacterium]|nr:hydrogenase maturation nickel metallochaperone HypA [Caldilineales bacterium]MDW8316977.1 hydrogenase maturation nickel metallochaperone HypA [Anaerolineae bacterium]
MHELAITQSVLDIAVGQAQRHGARRITAVNLVVGELTGYVPDSIQFYFDLLSRGTPAEAAALNVRRVPTQVRCRQCRAEFRPEEGVLWVCPACGGLGGDLLSGNELLVESIEVE